MDFISRIESRPSTLAGKTESHGQENYETNVHTLEYIAQSVR